MSPRKTRICSAALALVLSLVALPVAFFVLLALADLVFVWGGRERPSAFAVVLAFGAALAATLGVFRAAYDMLCERWSEEIVPPRLPRWPCWPLHRPLDSF